MGLEAATIALIAGGLSAAQGVAGYMQGQAQAKSAKSQAAYNQQIEENRRTVEKDRQTRQLTLAQGEARTRAAGSGATLGSFEDVLDDNQTQGLLDIALGEYDSQITRQRINFEGKSMAAQAKSDGISSLLSGAAGVASAGSAYSAAGTKQKELATLTKLAGKK